MGLRSYLLAGTLLLAGYLALLGPFTRSLGQKPYAEKLGLLPRPEVLKVLFADYQELVGASVLTRVSLYFGALVESAEEPRRLALAADYPAMSRAVHAALQLDPYNMDGYYFGQAILAWDAGQYKVANELLEYGMKYRTWDWQLPFFAGFNYAFFLKDRAAAARMYMRAGELSGEPMFKTLAGRYLQEAGQTQMAIDYLGALEKDARDTAIRRTFRLRIEAFKSVLAIEKARDRFLTERGVLPASIDELVTGGYLPARPADPYGGRFYFDSENNVRSTSKFSFASQPAATPGSNSPARPPTSE